MALLGGAGLREQLAHLLVEHLHGGDREPRLQVDQLGGQGRAAATDGVVRQQERWRDRALPHQLPEATLVDGVGDSGVEPDLPHIGQTREEPGQIPRRGRVGDVAKPGDRRHSGRGIGNQQGVEGRDIPPVLQARLGPASVDGEQRLRQPKLVGQVGDEFPRRRLVVSEPKARVAQQRHPGRCAQSVGVASPSRQKNEIGGPKRVVARQGGALGRDAEQ